MMEEEEEVGAELRIVIVFSEGDFFRFLLRSIMLILNDNIIQSSRIKSNVIRRDCSTCQWPVLCAGE